jgi:hypothetical protein
MSNRDIIRQVAHERGWAIDITSLWGADRISRGDHVAIVKYTRTGQVSWLTLDSQRVTRAKTGTLSAYLHQDQTAAEARR